MKQGVERIRTEYSGAFAYREADRDGAAFMSLLLAEGEQSNIEDYAVSQNLTTLRNRVNELGVSEPLVQRQGEPNRCRAARCSRCNCKTGLGCDGEPRVQTGSAP